MNISLWLKHATQQLNEFESAELDAQILLCHALECDRTKIYTWPNQALSDSQLHELNQWLTRREQGEPIAYIVGQREFWSLELEVSQSVLVPRADTELIVELAMAALDEQMKTRCTINGPVLDAGTGSGAIAIALAHEYRDRQTGFNIVATDFSTNALALAQRNAQKHQLSNIQFARASWLDAFADNTFAMIISNPPYLAETDAHLQNKTLQFEPQHALISGSDGLNDIRQLIKDTPRAGKTGCKLLLEHGATQALAVRELMHAAKYSQVQTHQDMPGLDRVTSGIVADY